ncbi:hypothetical protein Tco_0651867 [Tanacetum coccineum]|uniref:Uncharacterized protein n=1 Tax=Tanacetum coccineum TaxID=301880 RepID=A0ABQ4WWA3_9ASTR
MYHLQPLDEKALDCQLGIVAMSRGESGNKVWSQVDDESVAWFRKQDLFHLYDLVMKQYSETTPEGIELILWGDLKIMMESSTEENDQVERRYPLSKELLQRMLDLGLEVEEESTAALHLMAEQDIPPPTITAMKIPIIRKGEYDIWSMRMRQYICHTDHNLWDVIVNGDLEEEPAPTGETSAPPAPKTAKQLAAKRNQERVKSILLLAIPDEYLLKFHNVADAKSLWEAIKSRFGGNEESKKMQKNVLKHQFENFRIRKP